VTTGERFARLLVEGFDIVNQAEARGRLNAADEIIELTHSVDVAYRTAGCAFMMHDAVFKEASLLKDGDGNYLLPPGRWARALSLASPTSPLSTLDKRGSLDKNGAMATVNSEE